MNRTALFAALALTTALFTTACGGEPAYSTEDGAIRGFDPIAYWLDGVEMPGDPDITSENFGATWHFASEENRDLFESDPDYYRPQYGGWCATAMADGAYWQSEPDTFDFHDDKLFLFWGDHAKEPFVADWETNIERANASWDAKAADREGLE